MANPEHLALLKQGVEAWNKWRGVNLDLREPDLRKADLSKTNLNGVNLNGANLNGANLNGANLRKADLSEANLREANLVGADLGGANLRGAYFERAHLREAHLEGANLRGANLSRAYLYEADLRGANLEGAHLEGANLRGANLSRAYLYEADLRGANLEGANLEGADLRRAYLNRAHLYAENLRGMNLEGVNLEGVNFEGVNFEEPISYAPKTGGELPTYAEETVVEHKESSRQVIRKPSPAEEPPSPSRLKEKEPFLYKPPWYEILQQEINRLPVGRITYDPPNTMKLGVKERVETRISRDRDANLTTSLRGRGVPQVEKLKISELMKVRLSADDFDIVSLNEEEQIITRTGFTEWAWDVTPKKSGKRVLHLHVTLRIRLPFGEERKDHPVLDREIVVKVNPVYSVKSFFITYWKWIVTALILPLIGWFWKTYIIK